LGGAAPVQESLLDGGTIRVTADSEQALVAANLGAGPGRRAAAPVPPLAVRWSGLIC
jgi:hypothetical protein